MHLAAAAISGIIPTGDHAPLAATAPDVRAAIKEVTDPGVSVGPVRGLHPPLPRAPAVRTKTEWQTQKMGQRGFRRLSDSGGTRHTC